MRGRQSAAPVQPLAEDVGSEVTALIRIAICDDEKEAVTLHEDIVRKSLKSCGFGYEIVTYTRSDNLLDDITEDRFFYDLILLDIEMPGVTGMEISERIKPCLPNVKIIFITSHMEYVLEAFELSIFRYVPKDNLESRLTAAVTEAVRLIGLEEGRELIIQAAGQMEKIPHKDIFYIRRDGGKNAVICSARGTSKVRKSLQQVFTELNAPEFLYIDRGYIVNLIQIMKVSGGMAFLKNGETLPISRSHLPEVKRQLNRFWGAHI